MAVISRTFLLLLRAAQLASAVIVAAILGRILHGYDEGDFWPGSRLIYTEVIAGLSILTALLLFIPFTAGLTLWPLDLIYFILWIVSFGLLADMWAKERCNLGYPGDTRVADECSQKKAIMAFAFFSAMLWLASAILGFMITRKANTTNRPRRRWVV